MDVGLGAALGGEAGRLVDDDRLRVAVDHHLVDEGDLVLAQPRPLRLRPRGAAARLGGRDPDGLAGLDPVARRGALAVDPKLAGPRPARDEVEAGVGQVALEPAVEADAVIVGRDDELADLIGGDAHAAARTRKKPA